METPRPMGPATHMAREKGPGCLLQGSNNPWAPFQARIVWAPEDACVSADTSLSLSQPAVSQRLCNHSGPRPADSPGPGNHSPPLPRLPPAARSGACSHSPGGPPACLTVLSPLILLSCCCLLPGTRKCGSPAGLSLPERTCQVLPSVHVSALCEHVCPRHLCVGAGAAGCLPHASSPRCVAALRRYVRHLLCLLLSLYWLYSLPAF